MSDVTQRAAHVVRARPVAAVIFGLVLVVAGVASMWNPWQLVVLDVVPGVVLVLAGVALAGLASWRMTSSGRVWRRRLSGTVGGLAAALFAGSLVLMAGANLLTPFAGEVLDEQRVDVGDGVSVVRRVWSAGALDGCVEFHVRSGDGVRARAGKPTVCVDMSDAGRGDYEMRAGTGGLTITRSDGEICTYSVDASSLRLVAGSASACDALAG